MSSIVITVSSDKTQTTLSDRYRLNSSLPVNAMIGLSAYFHAVGGGLESASVSIQTGAVDAVRASGTATIAFATLLAADTVTIAGSVLTCTTGTPSTAQFQKITDGTTTAVNLAAAINAHATLSQMVSATSSAAVVTLISTSSGLIGNLITSTASSLGVVMGAATLAGGAGGANNAPIVYARGR